MGKVLSVLLIIVLALGSLCTLALSAGLRDRPAIAFESPSAVSAVRAYYAAVNLYFASGDIEAISEIAGPDVLRANERSSSGCADTPRLSALRGTYPHLRISIDDLLRDGSTVIAQVSVDAGPATSFRPVALQPLAFWRMTESFTVVDGRIVSCATFGPGQALVATMHHMNSRMAEPGTLVIARISFARDAQNYLSIPAPAIVAVEQGSVTTPGNGVSMLSRANGQYVETTEPGTEYRLGPGDELTISVGRVVLHNADDHPASVLATTIVPNIGDVSEAEANSQVHLLFERLAAQGGGDVGAGTWAQTLARSAGPSGSGPSELMAASIVVTPGGSATIEDATSGLVLISLIGNPLIERNGSQVTIRNPGDDQVVVRIAEVEPPVPSK